jgi:hypothetical protein
MKQCFGGGKEFYPLNGKCLFPKSEKSEIGNFRKQNQLSPKYNLGDTAQKLGNRNIIKTLQSQ